MLHNLHLLMGNSESTRNGDGERLSNEVNTKSMKGSTDGQEELQPPQQQSTDSPSFMKEHTSNYTDMSAVQDEGKAEQGRLCVGSLLPP